VRVPERGRGRLQRQHLGEQLQKRSDLCPPRAAGQRRHRRKRPGQRTFEVLPRRWVVERTLSWISRCRRLAHDYERLPEHSEAMVKWAMIGLMTRRLAPTPGRRPWQASARS
jgi:transposase